jgi:hypothetical protein
MGAGPSAAACANARVAASSRSDSTFRCIRTPVPLTPSCLVPTRRDATTSHVRTQ